MHDPGFFFVYAQLRQDQSIDEARELLVKTVEGVTADPPTQEEVDRAKTRILKNVELMLTNSQTIGLYMSEFAAAGDWRLLFLGRDEVKNVTPADVVRVGKAYLKSSNRTLGEFIPTKTPDRAEIPATPETTARLKDFRGGEGIQQGESFDPTPKNIESRTTRVTLPNGLKLLMLPKKTRGAAVVALLNVRFGDEKSLFGKSSAATFAGALLMRGTKNKNRQQIQDETDRLKAQIGVSGGLTGASANIRTLEANLEGSLRFVRELLREPSFPEAEFEQLRQQRIASIESGRSEPTSLASREMSRHLNSRYKRGDSRYTPTIDEDLEDTKKVTIAEVRNFYTQFYGVGEGEIAIVGQFDPVRIQKLVTELFGDWKSPARYERITNPYEKIETINRKIETPDKQNAIFLAVMPFKMNDDDPDLAALTLANPVFGSGANSRILQRIRIKEGLSYGASAGFGIPTKDDRAMMSANAIAAPQNMPKLESIFNEEVAKALKEGFTADEVEKAKKAWLEQRQVGRAEDTSLASLLISRERWGRTLNWDEKLESSVGALTAQQVTDAFRRRVDPSAISIIKGGDFKKAGAFQ